MRRVLQVFVLLLLLSAFVNDAQAKPSAKDFLRRGDVQLRRNNLVKAIRDYTKAIELDGTLSEAYLRRGIARRLKGNLNAAIEDFDRAQAIDPSATLNNRQIADSYSNRGFIEMNDLETAQAISDFTKAIHSYPDPTHYYRRGQARLIEEDLEGAINDFNQALALNPHNQFLTSMIYINRGYALLLQGKDKYADADFRNGLKIHNGQRVIMELHLRTLEWQIKLMRQRRVEMRRNVA
jgi:tetratricopeptide (TPR) repeat protein